MEAQKAADVRTTTDRLTEAALAARPNADYDASEPYGNPLADATLGQSYNWTRHLVPENAVDEIRSYDTIAEGVARVAESAIEALYDYSPETEPLSVHSVIGAYKAVAARFGVGALGERHFAHDCEKVVAPRPGDENAGVDVRTADGVTFQVKTGDDKRSDWDKKDADHLVWVKPGDEWTATVLE
jgi:hypothetical protein